MCLRYDDEPDDVFLVDATNEGVSVKAWSDISHALGNFYSKVAYRRLKWEPTPESLEVLEQFLQETENAQYKFSLE